MSLQDEIEQAANQYGGVGAANNQETNAVRAILEPVFGQRSNTRLRTLRDGLWARSRREGDRYSDLAQMLDMLIRRKK